MTPGPALITPIRPLPPVAMAMHETRMPRLSDAWGTGSDATPNTPRGVAGRKASRAPAPSEQLAMVHPQTGDLGHTTGNSFAAPQVAAVAAILKSLQPSLSPTQLRDYLTLNGSAGAPGVGGVLLSVSRPLQQLLLDTQPSMHQDVREAIDMDGDQIHDEPGVVTARICGGVQFTIPEVGSFDLTSETNPQTGTLNTDPGWRYLAIARLVITAEHDPTAGALYVFSQQDVNKFKFNEEAATLVLRASDHRALLFYVEWPGEGAQAGG